MQPSNNSHSQSQSQLSRSHQQASAVNNPSAQDGNPAYGHGYPGGPQAQHLSHSHGNPSQPMGSTHVRTMPFMQNAGDSTSGRNVDYQQSYGQSNVEEPYLDPNVPAHYRHYRPLHQGHPVVPSQQPSTGTQFIPTPSQLYSTSASQAHLSHAQHGSSNAPGASSSTAPGGSSSMPAPSVICELCGTTFTRAHDRKRHFESHHTDTSQHICIYCKKGYARPDSLKRHYDKPCDKDPRGGAGKA